jgi:hypothetical protein
MAKYGAKWMDEVVRKEAQKERAYRKQSKGYDLLREVFIKYEVSFADNFTIEDWEDKDKLKFIDGLIIAGYPKSLLKNYCKDIISYYNTLRQFNRLY